MSLFTAKKQFEENLRLFGDSNRNPEKFNLYAGLVNLTDALIKIESDLDSIKRKQR